MICIWKQIPFQKTGGIRKAKRVGGNIIIGGLKNESQRHIWQHGWLIREWSNQRHIRQRNRIL